MTDRTRFPRWFQLVAFFAALAMLAACGDSSAGKVSAPEEPDDEVEVGVTQLRLAQGRSVAVEVWDDAANAGDAPPSMVREQMTNVDGFVWLALPSVCRVDPKSTAPGTGFSPPSYGDFVNWGTLLCMGQLSMMIAETVAPVYFGVSDDGLNKAMASTERMSNVRYSVAPPSASDAASWALLATDYFRGASIYLTRQLSKDARRAWDWGFEPTSTAPTGYLAEALAGMIEAADAARRFVAAAYEAEVTANPNSALAKEIAWRGVEDSRLLAASIYAHAPAHLFQDGGRIPMYNVRDEVGVRYLSSRRPELLPKGHQRHGDPVVWLLAPTLLYDAGAVWTYRDATTGLRCSGVVADCASSRVQDWMEGYPIAEGQPLAWKQTNGTYSFLFPAPTPMWSGYTLSTDRFDSGPQDSRVWPVLRDGSPTSSERLAMYLIRKYRLDPTQAGDAILTDLLLAVRADHPEILAAKTDATLTEAFGVAAGDLKAGARRIIDRARVLGEVLLPVPNTASPRRYLLAPERPQPVDAAYLAAQLSLGAPPIQTGSNERRWEDYAKAGVFNVATYLMRHAADISANLTGEAARNFNRATAFARELEVGSYSVSMEASGFDLKVVDTRAEDVAARFQVFIGEAGLEHRIA